LSQELCDRPAVALAALLRNGEVSAAELTEASLGRIAQRNPALNAIVTLTDDRARADAAAADRRRARGEPLPPLHGLPFAHKDSVATAGIRTTSGSPVDAALVPAEDALLAVRARHAGAVLVGKTNLPEFGAGSHTFNPVFGVTHNPHAPGRSAGGSSGGSAAAVAAGMVALADGSDMGGSLRNPASFCGVVGFRPTLGLIPAWPAGGEDALTTDGPIGRTVADAALLLSVQAADPRLAGPLTADPGGLRVAVSERVGGLPVEAPVRDATRQAAAVLSAMGCRVEAADPPTEGADRAFEVLRAAVFARDLGPVVDEHRELVKEAVRWNVERGRELTAAELTEATALRDRLRRAWDEFLERFDAVLAPVSQVLPFPVEWEYPAEVEGVAMHTYIEWMRSCTRVSVTGCPALAVPAGRSADGLPVGVQLVGRRGDDLGVLRLGAAFEAAQPGAASAPPPSPR
jgi:amidase